MEIILRQLEKNALLTPAQLACMLDLDEDSVKREVKKLEDDHVILGYKAMVDWEKTDRELVTALIEVKVTPQRGEGFDRVAARIYQYPEVDSVYLMSGGFDLTVIIVGKTMKEVALFVSSKLATMDSVTGTATHFVLKKYKDKGVVFGATENDDKRELIV